MNPESDFPDLPAVELITDSDRLAEALQPFRIYLFGSRAEGRSAQAVLAQGTEVDHPERSPDSKPSARRKGVATNPWRTPPASS